MAEETNQAETKRTLWRMGVVGHPDYRHPTSPKASSDPEKKTLFPVKIRCTRNFTLRKKSPNSNLPSSPGIQLQSFSKLHLTSQSGSPTKGENSSTAENLSSQGSLAFTDRDVHKYEPFCQEVKKEHALVRPRSCAADIDVSLTMKRRGFAGSSSWKGRVLDNNDEEGPNDPHNESERERQASLDLIRESLSVAFGPDQRQMSDDQVFEEDEQARRNEDGVPLSAINQTSFDDATSYFTAATIDQTGDNITHAVIPESTTDAGTTQSKPVVKRRIRGILGSRTMSAVYDSLPSSPLFNPGETWRYKDASTQCQEEEPPLIAVGTSMVDKKTEQRRRKYGRAFRQKRAATIGGNSEPTTVESRRKPLGFSRSQSECCSAEGGEQLPHTFSFRHFREKKRNTLHFPDYLIASMTLLPDYVNFMGDNKR